MDTPGILVIEGNAAKLKRQGISRIVDDLEALIATQVNNGALRRWRTPINTAADLQLAKSLASVVRYDAVMLVAHGNPTHVELGDDPRLVMEWRDAARILAPVQPRFLLAVSCFAGGSLVTDALFEEIPTLEAIVGSPAPLTVKQAQFPLLELYAAAMRGSLPDELGTLLKIGNFLLTNGIIIKRTRGGLATSTPGQRLAEDLGLIVGRAFWQQMFDDDHDDSDDDYHA